MTADLIACTAHGDVYEIGVGALSDSVEGDRDGHGLIDRQKEAGRNKKEVFLL